MLTERMKDTLRRLAEGYELTWVKSPSWPSSCALYSGGGSYYRVRPATLRGLERRGLIEIVEYIEYYDVFLTPAGREAIKEG